MGSVSFVQESGQPIQHSSNSRGEEHVPKARTHILGFDVMLRDSRGSRFRGSSTSMIFVGPCWAVPPSFPLQSQGHVAYTEPAIAMFYVN